MASGQHPYPGDATGRMGVDPGWSIGSKLCTAGHRHRAALDRDRQVSCPCGTGEGTAELLDMGRLSNQRVLAWILWDGWAGGGDLGYGPALESTSQPGISIQHAGDRDDTAGNPVGPCFW